MDSTVNSKTVDPALDANVRSAADYSLAPRKSWLKDVKIYYSPTYVILASLAINVLSLALPIASLQVYDRIIAKNGISTLNILAIGVIVALALESILQVARSYVSGWIGAVMEHRIYSKAVRHMLDRSTKAKFKNNIGPQMQQLNAVTQLREFYSGQALATLIDLPFVLVFMGLIFYLAKMLVLVPIAVLGLFMLRAYISGRIVRVAIQKRDQSDDRRYNFIIDTLTGIHTTKSLGLEKSFIRKYETLQSDSSRNHYHLSRLSAEAVNDGQVYGQIMIACIVAFGAPMVVQGLFSMGSLIACILLAGRILQPVQRTFGLWLRFQDFEMAQEKLDDFFADSTLPLETNENIGGNNGQLILRNVTSNNIYKNGNSLENINLSLYSGDCIAITGENEDAKTALLRLMVGLERAEHGEIVLNGTPVESYPNEKLIQHIAYLPMEGVIFQGSIYDNLSHFRRIEAERVQEMAALLGIDIEIAKLPLGMDTILEDIVADPVPPGLKQRIAIARSLAYKPRLILFNNADRDLDKEGYNMLYRLLGRLKGKATLVLVSDDKNIRSLADHEYNLSHGHLTLIEASLPRHKSMHLKSMEAI